MIMAKKPLAALVHMKAATAQRGRAAAAKVRAAVALGKGKPLAAAYFGKKAQQATTKAFGHTASALRNLKG
jgi:hypothetical protein